MRNGLLLTSGIFTDKKYILPFLISFIALTGFAQTLAIKKTVVSASDYQPVKFASVAIRNSNKGTYTNLSGEFTISCNSADSLTISAIGYRKSIYHCSSLSDTILLREEPVQLPEVIVSSKEQRQHTTLLGLYNKNGQALTQVLLRQLYILITPSD
jgi:hypothetical protein